MTETIDAVLDALGDATRRRIYEAITAQERSVGDLAALFPISRPAVSRHLRLLTEAGLVVHRAAGTRHVYSATPTGVAALRHYTDDLWTLALNRLATLAEAAGVIDQAAAETVAAGRPRGADR